jgi:small subunit ribosomal protein S17
MAQTKEIGYGIEFPAKKCTDKKCPFHGKLRIHGRTFTGTVVSKDTNNTAIVEWVRRYKIKKYERYELRRSKVASHNPTCINAQVGDKVQIYECRPISKTKTTVIVKVLGENLAYKQKQEVIEADKKAAEKAKAGKGKKKEDAAKAAEEEN